MTIDLPDVPFPLQVEIELTNACNAQCTACPRTDMPPAGMMTEATLERILDRYRSEPTCREPSAREDCRPTPPRVTVAGGGEPLLHKRAVHMVEQVVAAGFRTTLITNGSKLTPQLSERLVGLGLHSLCISFWGVEEREYERAMRLPYRATLDKVEHVADLARKAGTPLTVIWVRSAEIVSSVETVEAFWSARGIEVDLGDNEPWNRGGLVGGAAGQVWGHLPDPSRRIWCADLYFSDAYTWAGDCVLCCCNYFTREQFRIGNVWDQDVLGLARRKAEILARRPLPAMCQACRLPRDKRGAWLAAPVRERLSPTDRAMLLDYPDTTEGTVRT